MNQGSVTYWALEIWHFSRSGLAVDFMQGGVLYESHPLVPTIDFDEGGPGWGHAANPTVPPTTQGLHRTRSGRSSAFRCLRCYRTFLGRGLRIPASRSFRFWCPRAPTSAMAGCPGPEQATDGGRIPTDPLKRYTKCHVHAGMPHHDEINAP